MKPRYDIDIRRYVQLTPASVYVVLLGNAMAIALAEVNLMRTHQPISQFKAQEAERLEEMQLHLMRKTLDEVSLFISDGRAEKERYTLAVSFLKSGDFRPITELHNFINISLVRSAQIAPPVNPSHRLEVGFLARD